MELKVKDYLPVIINEEIINQALNKAEKENKWVLMFIVGTKPGFYKFYGSIKESRRQGVPYIIVNANQHYDKELTYGIKEFGLDVGCELNIRGGLLQKTVELLLKLELLSKYLSKKSKATIVPVVLGDTILTSITPIAWMFTRNQKVIQNEAGLRGMTPTTLKNKRIILEEFYNTQPTVNWDLMRNEPFPEQWDTYVSAAGSQYLFAPTELNKQHLIREGYNPKNVFITGGVVVEALKQKLKEKPEKSVFNQYPELNDGEWIRIDIHRRGNLTPNRFKAITEGIKKLVKKGYKINFIEMNATKYAINKYGLRSDYEELKKNKNFLMTGVWPEYSQVIEFYNSKHCLTALTDSGGVQEEMNLLKKPCLTCRFNTDRPETVIEGKSNLLVPAISGDFIKDSIDYLVDSGKLRELSHGKKLYGDNVAEKFIGIIKNLMNNKAKLFTWAHEELGYEEDDAKSLL